MKKFIVSILIAMQMSPTWAATRTSLNEAPQRVAIVRVGQSAAPDSYPQIQASVKRWLENLSGVKLVVDPSRRSIHSERLKSLELEANAHRAIGAFSEGSLEESDLTSLKQRLGAIPRLTPVLQRLYAAEAERLWRQGRHEEAKLSLSKALKVHPLGEVDFDWETTPPELLAHAEELRRSLRRNCWIEVVAKPSHATWSIDGFSIAAKRVAVLSKNLVRVRVEATGFEGREEVVSCARAGNQTLQINLKPGASQSLDLSGDAYDSYLFVQEEAERFRLILYTSNHGFDRLPLALPIRVAKGDRQAIEKPLETASDAVEATFEKHRMPSLASLSYVGAGEGEFGRLASDVSTSAEWYNDWRVWTIAGLLAGGVAAYLISRKGSSVSTQGRLPIKIQ